MKKITIKDIATESQVSISTVSFVINDKGEKIQVYLITGEMVTKENIDKVLIESGYYTKEQIYGNN